MCSSDLFPSHDRAANVAPEEGESVLTEDSLRESVPSEFTVKSIKLCDSYYEAFSKKRVSDSDYADVQVLNSKVYLIIADYE